MPTQPPELERFQDAKRIFLAIRDLGLEQRETALDDACSGDTELREMVLELLRGQEAPLPFESLAEDIRAAHERVGDSIDTNRGTQIGPYRLLQRIGEGGFGVVYMAEQSAPIRRRVALKLIKLGMDTKQVVARFESERQALAMMDHPNIAKVLDAGSTSTGRPYFVMELVRGVLITQYCDTHALGTAARMRLFLEVCGAIQHAHHKGVIHRDIKPSNVLVTLYDGKPVPKVIDFGVAKATHTPLTARTLFTEYGQMIGTPQYMSPERAEMSGLDVDARTDIYSLGVLMYELLTGTTPQDAKALRSVAHGEMHRLIREGRTERPSIRVYTLASPGHRRSKTRWGSSSIAEIARKRQTDPEHLRRTLKGDLDWIVVRALEQDRTRRYDSAGQFAEDIERYLRGDAVSASPPSTRYQLARLMKRHRGPFAAAAVVLLVLMLGIIGTSTGLAWALHARAVAADARNLALEKEEAAASARDSAVESERLARIEAFEAIVISAGQAMHAGDLGRTQILLDEVNRGDRNHWWKVARAVASTRFDTPTRQGRMRWNWDQSLVSVVRSGEIEIRDPETFEILRTRPTPEEMVFRRLRWTADPGRFILTYSYLDDAQPRSEIFTRLYDAETLEPLGPEIPSSHVPLAVGDRTVVMQRWRDGVGPFESFDLRTGERLSVREEATEGGLDGESDPTSRWVRSNAKTSRGVLKLHSSPDFERVVEIDERTPRIRRPFSSDQQVVLRTSDGIVECWWINEEGVPAFGWAKPFQGSELSPLVRDGLVVVSEGNVRHVLDPATGRALIAPFDAGAAHSRFWDLDWDRRRFISETRHGARIFDLRDFEWPYTARVAESSATGLLLSRDGQLAIVTTFDGHFHGAPDMLRVLDPDSGVTLAKLMPAGAIVRAARVSPDGNFMAAGYVTDFGQDRSRHLRMWSLRTGRVLWERDVSDLGGGPRIDGFSLDSLVVYSRNEAIDVLTGETVGTVASEKPDLITPDGRLGVKMIRDRGRAGRAFDWASGETVSEFELDIGSIATESFGISPDSTKICIPDGEAEVKVFDLRTGELIGSLAVGSGQQYHAEWSRDGSRIATSGQDGYIQLWDAESFRLLGVLGGHDSYVLRSRFSRDGRSLYSVSGDGTYRIWNTRTPWEQAEFVERRRALAEELRPRLQTIAESSTAENAEDAWRALNQMDLADNDRSFAEALLTGVLLELHGRE